MHVQRDHIMDVRASLDLADMHLTLDALRESHQMSYSYVWNAFPWLLSFIILKNEHAKSKQMSLSLLSRATSTMNVKYPPLVNNAPPPPPPPPKLVSYSITTHSI
ncbi:hypothetical protein O6H91_11G050600 [Diphasiastrum complanatum]|uniref:Uncharacterized protein n=1 Tax=Diphasiastrum complanatum TaxID=34168 RepID=A0ACC2C985_DIPCM|nr:hypothetical protein O6H91_11G050600 [Diphasiastrum complanatum]